MTSLGHDTKASGLSSTAPGSLTGGGSPTGTSMAPPAAEAIDPTTSALLGLFDGPLRDVRFPDVDAEVLHDLADAVRTSSARVAAARAALVAAQGALVAAEQSLVADEQALLVRCQRALAYAHVFAAGNPSLRDALDAIHFAPPGAAPSHAPPVEAAPRRRGRPRKHPLPEGSRPALFVASDASPTPVPPSAITMVVDDAATAAE